MDLETLLAPVSEESPAGEDLSYDGERQLIEQAFDVPADDPEQPDWRDTIKLIAAQSERTKDVWLAIYLARAGARQGRLETIEAGCQMLAGLFERYWDSVHPTLDELGFQGRKGPLRIADQDLGIPRAAQAHDPDRAPAAGQLFGGGS